MTVRQSLEGGGFSGPDVEEATEGISAYLKGELDRLPSVDAEGRSLPEIVSETLRQIGQDPSFAVLFG